MINAPFSTIVAPAPTGQHSADAFFATAIDHNHPVALWRLPQQNDIHGVVDLLGSAANRLDLRRPTPGFAFAPFHSDDKTRPQFLNAHLYLNAFGLQNPVSGVDGTAFEHDYLQRLQAQLPQPVWPAASAAAAADISSESAFRRLVADAVAAIQRDTFRKVVLSRVMTVPLSPDFSPVAAFNSLCARYPHAFVSLVSLPGQGTWLGASPEPLLNLQERADGGILQTVALAGTRPYRGSLTGVDWSPKEIEEQALVSQDIRHFFQRHRLNGTQGLQESAAHTVQAGNVVHLRSDFRLALPQAHLFELANRVIHELHPTPAVCGLPKTDALRFILNREPHQRRFYSGFLGPVHLAGQTKLFVNLRCLSLSRDAAALYVGAGVTRDSEPAAEWAETALKAQTLLAVL